MLGFATGSTPERMYQILIEKYNQGVFSFEGVRSFNLDEYVGLGPHHRESYQNYMNQGLLHKINILKDNAHIPNGLAACLETEWNVIHMNKK